jgi:hypothetical protein
MDVACGIRTLVVVSRDGPEGTRRVYVQDIISRDAKRFWELVHDSGAWLYISRCIHFIGPSWEAYVDGI